MAAHHPPDPGSLARAHPPGRLQDLPVGEVVAVPFAVRGQVVRCLGDPRADDEPEPGVLQRLQVRRRESPRPSRGGRSAPSGIPGYPRWSGTGPVRRHPGVSQDGEQVRRTLQVLQLPWAAQRRSVEGAGKMRPGSIRVVVLGTTLLPAIRYRNGLPVF